MNFKQIKAVHVFMDYIIVSGNGIEECKARTDMAIEKLKNLNLTLNMDKCEFGQPEVVFLGMRLDKTGIHPTYSKLEALKSMRPPAKINELRGFLRLLNFFHTFVPMLQEKTKEMRTLLKKSVDYVWTSAMQQKFELAKRLAEARERRYASTFRREGNGNFHLHRRITKFARCSNDAIRREQHRKAGDVCLTRNNTSRGKLRTAWFGSLGSCLDSAKMEIFTLGRWIVVRSDASALLYIYTTTVPTRSARCADPEFLHLS